MSSGQERQTDWQRVAIAAVAVGVMLTACKNAGEDRVLGIPATGLVAGLVFFDQNGNGAFDAASENPLADVALQLLAEGSREEVAVDTSQVDGAFVFGPVPVGSYVVDVDDGSLGDTVVAGRIDSADVALDPDDSVSVTVAITYPAFTAADARVLVAGLRIFVEGVALNARGDFGDSTVHIWDASGVLRTARVANAVSRGDSVRARGTTATINGQPVLDEVTAIGLGQGTLPQPETLSTVEAGLADGGRLDAALVALAGVTITDTLTAGNGDYVATVDDGTGPVDVVFDQDLTFPLLRGRFVPGASIDATGLLIPTSTGSSWILKPRGNGDLVVN
jgi:hypothetical protein